MDGCDQSLVSKIHRLPRSKVQSLFTSAKGDELAISLLNLLHNIVKVGSVQVSATQKAFFNENSELVLQLLGRRSLAFKRQLLENNIDVVINIAASCPVAGT